MTNTTGDRVQVQSIISIFKTMQKRGEGALEQLSLEQFQTKPEPNSNSIAIIVAHLHGNMLSRWTDFLTSDGEKPWRNRDLEFEEPSTLEQRSVEGVMVAWEQGWACVFAALEPLSDTDLEKEITIRGQKHSVFEAILRQVDHYGGHVGQMVYLAKWLKGNDWKTLSIARGQSKAFKP
jgi:hypothetical protein